MLNFLLSFFKWIIILGVKYLEWRIKLYIELSHIYDECGSLGAASRTIDECLLKLNELKAVEEGDPPLP